MTITENLQKVKKNIPENVKLVAVSKTKPAETILEAYNAGHKIFGENKVQELVQKYSELPKDIEWHFIGHLQTNKVKYIIPFVHLIHSVDSMKLLKVINKEAKKSDRLVNCLLQLKIAREETKFGMAEEEVDDMIQSEEIKELSNITITGLMGMATYSDDINLVSSEFRKLYTIFKRLQAMYFNTSPAFKEISMGMSHDYQLALNEGTTIVRIGSLIFGERYY